MKRILKRSTQMLGLITGILFLVTSCAEDDIMLTGITLDKVTAKVEKGATTTLQVFYTPGDATNQNITWRSSSTAVATVSAGVVTAVGLGTTVITAVSQADSTLQASAAIQVIPSSGMATVTVPSGDITASTTWNANTIYKLDGFVYVKNNATLTIEAGTLIKGISGKKATLIIERGSRIIARGTASQPIVFTSDKAKGARGYGDWGGVVICGNGITNKHDVGTGVGIAEGGIGSNYGGTAADDNSGVLQYVRIEFPGIPLTSSSNSEINGLTLYSVGSGTTIDHVQVSYSGDDSFEWFGGSVNCKYLVAHRGWDDDWDTDNGFNGKVQFFVSLRDPASADQSESNGFESDNDADGSVLSPFTSPFFVNGTVIGPLATPTTTIHVKFGHSMQLRRGTRTSIYNTVFAGWPKGLFVDGAKGDSPAQATANVLQIEKSIMAAMTTKYITTYLANTEAWYLDATRSNEINNTNDQLMLTSPFNLTSPKFLPASGSPLLTGAAFTNTRLTNAFFTPVTYRGAFGTTDWTSGWCNFDPQNTDY